MTNVQKRLLIVREDAKLRKLRELKVLSEQGVKTRFPPIKSHNALVWNKVPTDKPTEEVDAATLTVQLKR